MKGRWQCCNLGHELSHEDDGKGVDLRNDSRGVTELMIDWTLEQEDGELRNNSQVSRLRNW